MITRILRLLLSALALAAAGLIAYFAWSLEPPSWLLLAAAACALAIAILLTRRGTRRAGMYGRPWQLAGVLVVLGALSCAIIGYVYDQRAADSVERAVEIASRQSDGIALDGLADILRVKQAYLDRGEAKGALTVAGDGAGYRRYLSAIRDLARRKNGFGLWISDDCSAASTLLLASYLAAQTAFADAERRVAALRSIRIRDGSGTESASLDPPSETRVTAIAAFWNAAVLDRVDAGDAPQRARRIADLGRKIDELRAGLRADPQYLAGQVLFLDRPCIDPVPALG